jgi:hypothetical protein
MKLPKNSKALSIVPPMPSLGTAGLKSTKTKVISSKPTTKAPKPKSTRPGHWVIYLCAVFPAFMELAPYVYSRSMTSLIKYDAICRALAEVKAVDEVKDVREGGGVGGVCATGKKP